MEPHPSSETEEVLPGPVPQGLLAFRAGVTQGADGQPSPNPAPQALPSSQGVTVATAVAPIAAPVNPAAARRTVKYVAAVVLAAVGGLLGIVGAFINEFQAGGILVSFIGAPIIEELMKPAGVYIVLLRWPGLVQRQVHLALLSALGGAVFGLVESAVYIWVYVPDHTQLFVWFRWVTALTVHPGLSFIAGFSVNRRLFAGVMGEGPLFGRHMRPMVVAMVIHGVLNTLAFASSFIIGSEWARTGDS